MFHKILVAIDGSDVSKRSLQTAIDEAKVWNAEIHAVYVIETGMLSSIPIDNTLEVIYNLLESEGNLTMDESRETASQAGVELTTHIKQGHAGNEILKLADEIAADLIVLGSHGKSEIDRLLLGSVTSHVVRNSTVSTMVVRL
ncbi:MAG: universal stress protein UspA [Methanoculleus sp. SDB]|nr:MAG: universal stress protein UspA [Methanoculleus sp. SDB]